MVQGRIVLPDWRYGLRYSLPCASRGINTPTHKFCLDPKSSSHLTAVSTSLVEHYYWKDLRDRTPLWKCISTQSLSRHVHLEGNVTWERNSVRSGNRYGNKSWGTNCRWRAAVAALAVWTSTDIMTWQQAPNKLHSLLSENGRIVQTHKNHQNYWYTWTLHHQRSWQLNR